MRISDWSSDVCSSDLTIKLDQLYSTPDQSHSMMEPHATTAAWNNDKLTIWTSNQMIAWAVGDLAQTLRMPKESIHVMSPFIGGGFRSEEHTSELQSLMRISYAVLCLQKTTHINRQE